MDEDCQSLSQEEWIAQNNEHLNRCSANLWSIVSYPECAISGTARMCTGCGYWDHPPHSGLIGHA